MNNSTDYAGPNPGTINLESNFLDVPNIQSDEVLTPDDLLGFQWQIACGMVTFLHFKK